MQMIDLSKTKPVLHNPFGNDEILIASPTTESQREIWSTLGLDENASLCYNETISLELCGSLNVSGLDNAFQEVLKRHDSLRSTFSSDGKYFFVGEYKRNPLRILKATSLSEVHEIEKTEIKMKFDLSSGPCIRGTLVQLDSDKSYFIISAHHIICDGWSFAVILSELSDFYSNPGSAHLPLPHQFSEFAQEKTDSDHKKYWLNEFKTLPPRLVLPLDYERPAYRTYDSERIDVEFDVELVQKIKKLGISESCSFYTVLMASFNAFIHKISGTNDVVIGMASAAQSVTGKWDIVGHLVNLLPLRSDIKPQNSFRHHLTHTKNKMLDTFDHASFSFGSLLKELPLERIAGEIPLVNIVFNIDQQSPDQGLKFINLQGQFRTVPREFENFELFFNMVSCGERLTLECQYNKNLWTRSTIEEWIEAYIKILREVVLNPELTIESLHIPVQKSVSKKERVEVIKDIIRNDSNEQQLLGIWQDVLKLPKISVEDNFFALGGHSLLAVEVVNKIRKQFNCDFAVKEIFLHPTIIELASILTIPQENVSVSVSVSIPKAPGVHTYDVSYSQMQAWYLEEMNPRTTMHNLPSSIRIKSKVDRELMERTLHYMIDRHPAFRTSIQVEKGIPVQTINESIKKPALVCENVTEAELQSKLNTEAEYVFDIKNPPLYKARLYKLNENDYVFFFMTHHLIWDGWSFDIFFEELDVIYSALIKNEKPELTAPDVTYLEFTKWQKESVLNKDFDKELNYWKNKLHLPLPVLELPLDYKRPLNSSHVGKTLAFTIKPPLDQNLRKIAKEHSTSLFNLILTAFKVTLSKYSGLEDVIVGTPVRNRVSSDVLHTIGYFVNSVALRTDMDSNTSLAETLKRVSRNCVEAFSNQSLPFQVLLNELGSHKDKTRSPVFQTFFSYQDVSNRSACLNGTKYYQINVDKASTHTDLDLWIKTSDAKIEGAFEYRADLFNDVTIQRFKDCFFHLLEKFSEYSACSLKEISIVPFAQKELLLNDFNLTSKDISKIRSFHKYFEQIVHENTEKIALETSDIRMSYKELNEKANRVAHALIQRGVKSGDLVGISLNRHEGLMIAILGVLKSGAGYVPLDPGFPQDRLDYMIESSMPKLLITEASLKHRFVQLNVIELESLRSHENTQNPEVPENLPGPMYVIYTSGSTGKPKGVQISHLALSNFLISMSDVPGFNSSDKILAVTTFSFDIATLELYLPLLKGGCVYLAGNYDVLDGEALKEIINRRAITVMQATPSTWRLLLAANWKPSNNFKILCGGEAFPIDLAQKLISMGADVWNMYGPTETTVWSTCKNVKQTDSRITIGKPIDNTYIYILDEAKHLLPVGAAGEIFIGGSGLADGYFGRPDLTTEKFISNPFRVGEKMYSTGDFGRFTSQGEIECLGRRDGQVKVRGYRIELGEIELALSKIPLVAEAAVITLEVKPEDVRIIAFLKCETQLDEKLLRQSLEQTLPKYMIPSHFVTLKDLPKTLNGKIDKKALPQHFTPETEIVVSAPVSNSAGSTLRKIWVDVLGKDDFNDKDSFFDIGGNSLLAVQIFSRLANEMQIELPLSVLLQNPSFSEFSAAINKKQNSVIPVSHSLLTSLITIKNTGDKSPLYCFHGVGGNVLNYMSLAPYVKDRPLIAFQSRGLNGESALIQTVEGMASHYIREMRLLQPEGPYLLAGGSMGGMIALEVAKQLKDSGEEVEKLILLDTFGPDVDIRQYDKAERNFWKNFKISFFYRRKMFLNKLRVFILSFLGLPVPLEIKLFDLEMNNYRALWNYHPGVYDGDIHLIRGKMKQTGWYSDEFMGWRKTVTGKINSFEIQGSHNDFIESPELGPVLRTLV